MGCCCARRYMFSFQCMLLLRSKDNGDPSLDGFSLVLLCPHFSPLPVPEIFLRNLFLHTVCLRTGSFLHDCTCTRIHNVQHSSCWQYFGRIWDRCWMDVTK